MKTLPVPRVLVADNEAFTLRLLEATFRKGAFEVVACRNGAEALRAAGQTAPQLIVMDGLMTAPDSLSAIRQLKQNPGTQHIPVIVLSSNGQVLTQAEAIEAGADLYLTKPFSPTRLLAEARRILAEPPELAASACPSRAGAG